MSYFKIGDVDFSPWVKTLKISKAANYSAQANAAGDTVVDYINTKHVIEVGFIYVDDDTMAAVQAAIDPFNVKISFLNPQTKALEENMNCIIPDDEVEYYTVQVGKVLFKEFTLTFNEL